MACLGRQSYGGCNVLASRNLTIPTNHDDIYFCPKKNVKFESSQTLLKLIRLIENIVNIYIEEIYYENIFYDSFKDIYFFIIYIFVFFFIFSIVRKRV